MKTSIILLAGLAVFCAVPAVAETSSVPVSFAGLDLTSSSGQDSLNRRINQAARMICGTPDMHDLAAVMATRKCTSETLARAKPRVAIAIAASLANVQIAAAQ